MRTPLRAILAASLVLPGGPIRAEAQTPVPPLVGLASVAWGAFDHNRCVPDVSAQLNALTRQGELLGFRLREGRGLHRFFAHWQGIQRLSADGGRWMALSRHRAPIGFALVELGSRRADGAPFGSNRLQPERDPRQVAPPPEDGLVAEVPPPDGHDHGGGMQAVGQILAVPFEDKRERSTVVFWDVSNPRAPRVLHAFDHGALPAPHDPGHASAAGFVKLADGRFLLVTGERSSKVLDFFVSTAEAFDAAGFDFRWVGTLRGATTGGFQNINLVTQCDGTLFLVGTHNTAVPPPSLGADHVRWYQLGNGPDGDIRLEPAGQRHLICRACNFGAGAGVYVDPAGRLLLYGVEHSDQGPGRSSSVEEFRPFDRAEARGPEEAWAELFSGRKFTELRVRLEGVVSGRASLERAAGRVASLRWSAPPGWRLRLLGGPACRTPRLDLTGTGESDDLDMLGVDGPLTCLQWIPAL